MIRKLIGTVSAVGFVSVLLAGGTLLTLTGCEQQGPAETAGEKIDNAMESAGEKMEKAGDSIRDATDSSND